MTIKEIFAGESDNLSRNQSMLRQTIKQFTDYNKLPYRLP